MKRKRPDPRFLAVAGQRAFTPREYLTGIGAIQKKAVEAGWKDDPGKQKLLLLRGNRLKSVRELKQGCTFASLLGQVKGIEYRVALVKDQAHPADVFLLWGGARGVDNGSGIQLKELPPGYLNAETSLQALVDRLAADPHMPDVAVAVYLNRRLTEVGCTIPPILRQKIGGLWMYGATSEDGRRWALFGDLLGPGGIWPDLPLLI